MIKKELKITAESGLHARPASQLTNTCQKFQCDIKIEKGTSTIDPKSILGIMMLSAKKDDVVTVITDGSDEAEAMEAIEDLFNNNFGE